MGKYLNFREYFNESKLFNIKRKYFGDLDETAV